MSDASLFYILVDHDTYRYDRDCTLNYILYASLASMTAFPICLGFLQVTFLGPFGVTPKFKALARFCGFVAITLSSTVSSFLSIKVMDCFSKSPGHSHWDAGLSLELGVFLFELNIFTGMGLFPFVAIFSFTGVLCFWLFGGRALAVVPSDLFYPGAFAKEYLPVKCKGMPASVEEKAQINVIGRRFGCHSCGKRNTSLFFADHQPPTQLANYHHCQYLYPHCPTCSSKQGSALIHEEKYYLRVCTHISNLRLYHLWAPIPCIIKLVCFLLNRNVQNGDSDLVSEFIACLGDDLTYVKDYMFSSAMTIAEYINL